MHVRGLQEKTRRAPSEDGMKKGNCERRTEGGLNGEEGAGELKRRERESMEEG